MITKKVTNKKIFLFGKGSCRYSQTWDISSSRCSGSEGTAIFPE